MDRPYRSPVPFVGRTQLLQLGVSRLEKLRAPGYLRFRQKFNLGRQCRLLSLYIRHIALDSTYHVRIPLDGRCNKRRTHGEDLLREGVPLLAQCLDLLPDFGLPLPDIGKIRIIRSSCFSRDCLVFLAQFLKGAPYRFCPMFLRFLQNFLDIHSNLSFKIFNSFN